MYISPYGTVLHSVGTTREELKDAAQVTIPIGLFKFLMQLAVTNGDLNEAGYLKANPDVAEAVEAGKIESAPALHLLRLLRGPPGRHAGRGRTLVSPIQPGRGRGGEGRQAVFGERALRLRRRWRVAQPEPALRGRRRAMEAGVGVA